MTDITKCSGKDCKIHDQCYRYIAPSDTHGFQSYAAYDKQPKPCVEFIAREPNYAPK